MDDWGPSIIMNCQNIGDKTLRIFLGMANTVINIFMVVSFNLLKTVRPLLGWYKPLWHKTDICIQILMLLFVLRAISFAGVPFMAISTSEFLHFHVWAFKVLFYFSLLLKVLLAFWKCTVIYAISVQAVKLYLI